MIFFIKNNYIVLKERHIHTKSKHAKINHKLVNIVIKPTLTEQGYTLYSCSVCGCSYKDNYTPVREKPSKVTGLIFGARSADYV